MIFLSHNYNDKPVVEQIALKLSAIYGQNNVFYDSWSIQPGQGIIDKMNEGLTNCRYFLFFISKNSLTSEMVKLEWQNALFKAAQNRILFIPIRMDASVMPAILTQNLYIDLFAQGIEVALRQIVDVVNGNNTYREQNKQFSNMVAYKYREGNKLIIECHAEHFLEPISSFLFCTQQATEKIKVELIGESMCMTNSYNGITLENGYKTNAIYRSISKGTLPGFPFIVELSSDMQFDIEIVMHEKEKGIFCPIPVFPYKKK